MNLRSGRISSREIIRLAWFALPCLAFLARLILGLARLDEPLNDPDQYLPFAISLWSGKGFRYNGLLTAYRPPLYPLILAPMVGFLGTGTEFKFGLFLTQAFFGAGTCVLAMRSARAWLSSKDDFANKSTHEISDQLNREKNSNRVEINHHRYCWAVIVSGVIAAFDPVLLVQAALPMTETLAALLVTLAIHELVFRRNISAGVVFGLAALCRPSLLACLALVLAARLWPIKGLGWKRALGDCLGIGLATLVVITPWAVRNTLVFGEPVWTTTHGGYTFALANNPVYYEEVLFGPPGAVWSGPRQQAWMDSIGPMVNGMTEPQANRFLGRMTWQFVASEPWSFVISCIDRGLRFWAVSPSASVYGFKIRFMTAFWTVPFWFCVACGLCSKSTWQWPFRAVPAVVAGLAGVHLIYWTDIRMRSPIVPALGLIAGVGVQWLMAKNNRGESQS